MARLQWKASISKQTIGQNTIDTRRMLWMMWCMLSFWRTQSSSLYVFFSFSFVLLSHWSLRHHRIRDLFWRVQTGWTIGFQCNYRPPMKCIDYLLTLSFIVMANFSVIDLPAISFGIEKWWEFANAFNLICVSFKMKCKKNRFIKFPSEKLNVWFQFDVRIEISLCCERGKIVTKCVWIDDLITCHAITRGIRVINLLGVLAFHLKTSK